jgi:diguanylate cyclase (GGDEF)-like protein/PAS domain S-box-containing protein
MRQGEEPLVMDVSSLRMREATINAGIWLTCGVAGLGELYVVLTWERQNRTALALLFALAMVAGIAVWWLPRERIVRSRLREPFFLAWTMLDFAMLVIGTVADRGTASPLVLVFFVPVVFSSMSYPLASVVTVGIASMLSYTGVALAVGGMSLAYEVSFATALACTAAMSAWQAENHNRQHQVLAQVSRTDPLTGCLNRRGFEERAVARLADMRRRHGTGAVVVLDIDHFKPVNDELGHAAGDELLCWVASTLNASVRPGDAVGRIGGDEFAMLLPELDARAARAALHRIARALNARAPASLGLAMFPDDGLSLEELARAADVRLYASRKERGHGAGAAQTTSVEAPATGAPLLANGCESDLAAIDVWSAALEAMRAGSGDAQPQPNARVHEMLLDQIDASVVVTDMTGVVLCWNTGAESLYGWSSAEAVGRNARDLIVPADLTAARRLLEELTVRGRWDGELLVRRKDATLFTAYVRNRLVFGADGEPTAVVGVAMEVSERRVREEQDRRDAETLATIRRVESALAEDRLLLYAQPIVDIRSGRTVQHELLLRMREPDGRIVTPCEFLPVAEQYALIGQIDRWVIKQAAIIAGLGCSVQVNLSARSVDDVDTLEHIERCIEQHEVEPAKMVFEITETTILRDEQAALAFAQRVRELGCQIALDDFGTGYGTLTYLKRLPVDYLKIDIEFVRDLRSNAASSHVVQAVIALAKSFGLRTVAEGVEDAQTLALLGDLGVDLAQGYHLARPAPFEQRPDALAPVADPRARAAQRTRGWRTRPRDPSKATARL